MCKGLLVGIVSWGGECGMAPGVYTRISSYTGFEDALFVKCATNKREMWTVLVIIYLLLFILH